MDLFPSILCFALLAAIMTQTGCSDKATLPQDGSARLLEPSASADEPTAFDSWGQESQTGLLAEWIGHGAHLRRVQMPGGTPVLAALSDVQDYAGNHPHVGSLIGPVANRIAAGRFQLDGRTYDVPATMDGYTLHNSPNGFDAQVWDVSREDETLVFRHSSPDGYQGYPGNLDVTVRARLTDRELRIDFTAITDAPTPVNLTQHGYWNPSGLFNVPIDTLQLSSPADRYNALDESLIPTGDTPSVEGTAYDFRTLREIGPEAIDINLLIPGDGLREMAKLTDGVRTITVLSDYPGLQIHSGEALANVPGMVARAALAMEPQFPPNAVNRPIDGHDTILRPGEVYRQTILYRFDGPGLGEPEISDPDLIDTDSQP